MKNKRVLLFFIVPFMAVFLISCGNNMTDKENVARDVINHSSKTDSSVSSTPASENAVDFESDDKVEAGNNKNTTVKEIKKKYKDFFFEREGVITVSGIEYWTPERDPIHNSDIEIDLKCLQVYSICDINKDGIPEMIMSDGDHRNEGHGISPYTLLICTYQSGEVLPIFGIIGIRGEAYLWKAKGICAFYGGSDFGLYVFYRMEENGFEYEKHYYMSGMNHVDYKKECTYYSKSNQGKRISKKRFDEVVNSLQDDELMKKAQD